MRFFSFLPFSLSFWIKKLQVTCVFFTFLFYRLRYQIFYTATTIQYTE
jgi:hypothetical protein